MIHIVCKEQERFNLFLKKRKGNSQDKNKEKKRVRKKKESGLKVLSNVKVDRKVKSLIKKFQKSVLVLAPNKDVRERGRIALDPDSIRKTTIVLKKNKEIVIQSTKTTRKGTSQDVIETLMKNEE